MDGNNILLKDLEKLEEEERIFQEEAEQVKIWKLEIESYIQNLSNENADKLIKLFDKSSPIQKFRRLNEINYIAIWVMIFSEERRNRIKDTIFTGRNSIQEVMKVWKKAYFLLWRVEFECEGDAKEQFLAFLMEERFSLLALQYLLYTKSAYLGRTGVWLAQELIKIKNYGYAKTLLLFLKQQNVVNDEIDKLLKRLT